MESAQPSVNKKAWTEILNRAKNAARASPCKHSKRGAVIFHSTTGEVFSVGNNHPPGTNLCEQYCPLPIDPGKKNIIQTASPKLQSCNKLVIHAEMDALLFLRNQGRILVFSEYDLLHLKVAGHKNKEIPIPSGPPSCVSCSRHILDKGFRGVWLLETDEGKKPIWNYYATAVFHQLSLENDLSLK
ncbi:MAG TPA: hypothetical protein VFM02_00800 [Candidatus Paceibacterota bacterium]|nr:hypothetical protein [Candidatus Paceibacterota bacterium]